MDKSFKDWKENAAKRDNAIELGKKANAAKLAYEKNKTDSSLKAAYKQANKEYKKALSQNTTYRKGVVRKEVNSDASRKYLSEAKKVKKQLDLDPSNKALKKQYTDFMNEHDIKRADARRAVEVSTKRMRKQAALKRSATMTVKAVATASAIAIGVKATNKYLDDHQVTLNGKRVNFSTQNISSVMNTAKTVRDIMGYFY